MVRAEGSRSGWRAGAALRRLAAVGPLALCALMAAAPCRAADAAADPHAKHRAMTARADLSRSLASYAVPAIPLVREDGKRVMLTDELDDGRPVVLDFIYTTCNGICPLASQTFARLQKLLGPDTERVHLVSISIDPEQDTPDRLAEYAKQFHAASGWDHYTGTVRASLAAQRAFDVYRGDKMSHTPVTLVRVKPGSAWIRFDGFATADDLLLELGARVAAN